LRGVSLERIAEFQIDIEHGLALVAAELLEPGRRDAAVARGHPVSICFGECIFAFSAALNAQT
jgi:hypothetical protein